MTGVLESVGSALDPRCFVHIGLSKGGCRVVMTGAPSPRLVVDFDKPGSPLADDQTRCDYLLIAESPSDPSWVAPLELKRGQLHAEQVVRQLQAGASAAESIVPHEEAVRFRPVSVSGNVSKHERESLKRASAIRFHEHREPVRLLSCGDRLDKVLR